MSKDIMTVMEDLRMHIGAQDEMVKISYTSAPGGRITGVKLDVLSPNSRQRREGYEDQRRG